MNDLRLRELEREAALGGAQAAERLARARLRADGLPADVGELRRRSLAGDRRAAEALGVPSLIERLDAALRGSPVAETLNPGASEEAIAAAEAALGFALPAGLALLYRWRNGQHDGRWVGRMLFRDFVWVPVERLPALQRTARPPSALRGPRQRSTLVIGDGRHAYRRVGLCLDRDGSETGHAGQLFVPGGAGLRLAPSVDAWLRATAELHEADGVNRGSDQNYEERVEALLPGFPHYAAPQLVDSWNAQYWTLAAATFLIPWLTSGWKVAALVAIPFLLVALARSADDLTDFVRHRRRRRRARLEQAADVDGSAQQAKGSSGIGPGSPATFQ